MSNESNVDVINQGIAMMISGEDKFEGSDPTSEVIFITEKKELFKQIVKSRAVYCQLRFGVSETWFKLTKNEAYRLAHTIGDGQTPNDMEMYSGSFGYVESGNLYLG